MVQDAYGLRATGLMKGVYVRGLGGEVTSEGAAGACISPTRLRVGGGKRESRAELSVARANTSVSRQRLALVRHCSIACTP